MNQFIIENPVLSIVIAYIIGAVVMHIISALAIRMAVEKEVEKALGGEDDERIGLYPLKPSNAPVPPASIVHDRVLPIWLGKDEDGHCYLYFVEPQMHEAGTGPWADAIEGVYYSSYDGVYIDIFDLYKDEKWLIKEELIKVFMEMDNMKYGTRKLCLQDNEVLELINAIPGFH